jgi:LPXTG-motif cell wall-anchored protein
MKIRNTLVALAAAAILTIGLPFAAHADDEVHEQPPPEVTSSISLPTIDCETGLATTTETTGTTPYVWDGKGFILGETVVTTTYPTRPVTEIECPPVVVEPELVTLSWILPNGGTPDNVTWPQHDTGPAGEQADSFNDDGVLTDGEDHGWVISWTFEKVTARECGTVTPHIPETPETPTTPDVPEEPVGELAQTGGGVNWPGLVGGAALVLSGLGAVLWRRAQRA